MTPLERAARAAHAEHNPDPEAAAKSADPSWDGWKSWIPVIVAVLTAIREPGVAAEIAGTDRVADLTDDGSSAYIANETWRAMIDAILSEGPPPT